MRTSSAAARHGAYAREKICGVYPVNRAAFTAARVLMPLLLPLASAQQESASACRASSAATAACCVRNEDARICRRAKMLR